jgi:hypothetical protein
VTERRFPPPWTVEEIDAAFVVTDSAGQRLAYVYFEDEPGRRSAAKSFGALLDRAIERSQRPIKLIEAQPEQHPPVELKLMPRLRRRV